MSLVAELGDDGEVVGAEHAVDRVVARDPGRERLAAPAGLRSGDEDVVDAPVEIEARGGERIVVRPGCSTLDIAGPGPGVPEQHTRNGDASLPRQQAQLVAV